MQDVQEEDGGCAWIRGEDLLAMSQVRGDQEESEAPAAIGALTRSILELELFSRPDKD